jgi:NAD(P)-dependent dehydrogenase (short-subunit alcohol dehydrogenase family)
MSLSGRRALVTGGTRGIGAAVALRLLADGAEVLVTGSHGEARGPSGCEYRAVDFADAGQTEAFASQLSGERFDILVNNAGINRIAPFAEIRTEDFDRIHNVNLRAAFLLCRATVAGMRERRYGRIVNISSIYGVISKEFRASYSATKFGLDGLTTALAAEVSADNVLANCVAPGFIDTDLTRGVLGEGGMAAVAAQIPARRLGTPGEIAAFVAWLVGPENTYITGQTLVIDGGFSRI